MKYDIVVKKKASAFSDKIAEVEKTMNEYLGEAGLSEQLHLGVEFKVLELTVDRWLNAEEEEGLKQILHTELVARIPSLGVFTVALRKSSSKSQL